MQAITTVPADLATDPTIPARCELLVRMSLASTEIMTGGDVNDYQLKENKEMQSYYVNKNAQPNSNDHEVHVTGCSHFPDWSNVISLGVFGSCREAVREAKKYYSDTNGCYYCCNECHTT